MARKVYNDPINIDKKMWLEILNDDITDQNTKDILTFLLEKCKEYEERGGIIARKLKYNHHAACNGIIKSYGNRIINTYPNINVPKYENGKYAPFHVPFLGESKNGFFYWKLRPELAEALKEYKA
jgi:hypothetical protein